MKKILVAIDAVNPDQNAVDFACYLGELTHSIVTGVFLENLVADEKFVLKKTYAATSINREIDETSTGYLHKQQQIDQNITLFKQACARRSVRCNVHRDRGVPAYEIIAESRFADIIITDAETSFSKQFEGVPSKFAKDVLKAAECPVIIAPERFEGIDEIVFAYDGSKSAAFAVKQFTYLFPELDETKAVVLHVDKEGTWSDAQKQNLKEWLQQHYSSIGFEVLKGYPEDKLFDYLFRRKNAFVVMGAYGRSLLFPFFRESTADVLIRTVTQPFFISHY